MGTTKFGNLDYTVLVHDEGTDGMWAEVEELPGCFASGFSIQELLEGLREAIEMYLSTPESHVQLDLLKAVKVEHPPPADPAQSVREISLTHVCA